MNLNLRGFVVGDRILGQAADSHADYCAAYGEWGGYRFVGASAIGKLHLRENRPRDDAFAIRAAGVWLAVAVSDGAGSRPFSRYGASFAVEALCEQLLREATGIAISGELPSETPSLAEDGKAIQAEQPSMQTKISAFSLLWPFKRSKPAEPKAITYPAFDVPNLISASEEVAVACGTLTWYHKSLTFAREADDSAETSTAEETRLPSEEWVRRAFQNTRRGLEQFAQSRGYALRDLHCTLLGMLLNTKTGAVAVGHIGDGLVAALHPGLGAHPLVEALIPGEVGETYVLTQKDWESYLAVRVLSPQEAEGLCTFYLMTDGVADDCTHPPPEDIFQRWSKDIDRELRKEEPLPQTATRLLRWLATYEVKGSWDDRTLVVIMRSLRK